MKLKLFLFLILGLILSGCSASFHVKKAKLKCPECFDLDTTITELVFKVDTVINIDTNILVLLPPDTIKIDSIVFKDIKPSFNTITRKTGLITTKLSMFEGNLKLRSYLDSSFIYRYQDSIRVKDAIITNLKQVVIERNIIIKEQKTFIQKIKSLFNRVKFIVIGLIGLIIIILIFKFKR